MYCSTVDDNSICLISYDTELEEEKCAEEKCGPVGDLVSGYRSESVEGMSDYRTDDMEGECPTLITNSRNIGVGFSDLGFH